MSLLLSQTEIEKNIFEVVINFSNLQIDKKEIESSLGYPEDMIPNHFSELIDEIISELKSHNWYVQNPAITKIFKLNPVAENKNKLFLLGRNILQAAIGSSKSAIQFIANLKENVDRFTIDGENDLLNGILFEIYFNSNGKFRGVNFKNQYLHYLLNLTIDKKYKKSFLFIENQLNPYSAELFFIPSEDSKLINLNIVFVEKKNRKLIEYEVQSIKYEGKEVLEIEKDSDEELYYEPMLFPKFKEKLISLTSVPEKYLKITTNIEINESVKILFPYDALIKKS